MDRGTEIIPHSTTAGPGVQDSVLRAVAVLSEVTWAQTPDTTKTYAFGATITESKLKQISRKMDNV